LAKKYIKGIAWYFLHPKEKSETEFKIKSKIKEINKKLIKAGMTNESLVELEQRAKRFAETPVDKMNSDQWELLVKLMFL
jgi:hypothetical protein